MAADDVKAGKGVGDKWYFFFIFFRILFVCSFLSHFDTSIIDKYYLLSKCPVLLDHYTCCATCYTISMIKSFKHKGLEKFYESGSTRGIQSNHAKKLRMQLAALESAHSIDDMDIPGYRLHQLTGDRKGIWTITVNANWRLTFEFEDGNVYILNYEDYH